MESKFYNAEFKNQYIEESISRNNNVKKQGRVLFTRSADRERLLGKDLYDFTVSEILGFYKSLYTASLESLIVTNNQYKLYTAYAQSKRMVRDNQNHYAEITNELLNDCVHQKFVEDRIITRNRLLELLDDGGILNIADKVIPLAIFEGINGKNMVELTHLEPTDINPKTNMVSLYTGEGKERKVIKISDKLVSWCLQSAEEYEYYGKNEVIKKYIETDTRVLKRVCNSTVDTDHQRHKTINRRLDNLISITNCTAFSIGALKESGRLEKIRELQNKEKMTLMEALCDKDLEKRYGKIQSKARYIMKYGLD